MRLEDHINRYPSADYMDMYTGYIYKTANYKFFKLGIVEVYDHEGNLIGHAKIDNTLIKD